MKHRVRESVFNLIGPAVRGKYAVDLFAGSGALGLEAVSRGAVGATLIDQHFPTVEIIRQNAATLGVEDVVRIVTGNVFIWARRDADLPSTPWLVFVSPPWDFFVERADELLELIGRLKRLAPAQSLIVVEADERFDMGLLPDAETWDVRPYRPAVVAIS